ncbi:MAG: hypothetical protein R3E79_04850 [Caldilineaceae bacterium]
MGEALREALQQVLNDGDLLEQRADLGVLLVALLENRLMAVGAGAVVGLFTNGGQVDVFPSPTQQPSSLSFTETGDPAFEIYRQEAPVGVMFLLAGAQCLQYFSLRDLASTVAYLGTDNLAEIVAALCHHANVEQLPGLFVVTAPTDSRSDSAGAAAMQQPFSRQAPTPPAQQAPRRWGGLPAALQAPPPARPLSSVTARPAASAGEAGLAVTSDDDLAAGSSTSAALKKRTSFTWSTALQLGLHLGLEQVKGLITKALPDKATPGEQTPLAAAGASPTPPPSTYRTTTLPSSAGYAVDEAYEAAEGYESADYDEQSPVAAPAVGRGALARTATFKPPARAVGSRARLYILVALLLLILTPVVVTAVYWSRDMRNQEEAERALDMAEASLLTAETALQSDDKATARAKLTEAQTFILAADNLVGGRLTRADELNVRIQQELADLLQVQPLYALTTPLVRFVPEALPQRILVNDQDVYVLDMGRQVVQYYQLDPTRTMVTNPDGEVVLRQGATIENVTVGTLVDIAWQPPIAGVQDKAYLLLLDNNHNLFRYDRRVEGASSVALGGQDQLRSPVRMRVYADRLYVADKGANQLFRYSSDYTQPPTPWFNAQVQSDLSSLRAMDIDGDIWFLYTQGIVSRYRTGAQEPFALENSVGAIGNAVDIVVGDQGNSMVYIADRDQERILVYSKDGRYQRQFRAPEGHPLRDLQALFVDEIEDTIYILTQTSLFKHPLTQAN